MRFLWPIKVVNCLKPILTVPGPFVSSLANAYGFRTVCIAGAIIGAIASAVSYFATSIVFLYLSYGTLAGKQHRPSSTVGNVRGFLPHHFQLVRVRSPLRPTAVWYTHQQGVFAVAKKLSLEHVFKHALHHMLGTLNTTAGLRTPRAVLLFANNQLNCGE